VQIYVHIYFVSKENKLLLGRGFSEKKNSEQSVRAVCKPDAAAAVNSSKT
jgi:hypothetical protein